MDSDIPTNLCTKQPDKCHLLQLPAELRTKIYLHLLGNKTIHIGGTGHQPYTDEHLPNGRCSSCTARLSDSDCHSKFTRSGKAFKGTLNVDRFTARHRDCWRYPVSQSLNLSILRTCKKIHSEAAMIPFQDNVFTLARPNSLPAFLERLKPEQMRSWRTARIYSIASPSTWIGPLFSHQEFSPYLAGLRRLEVFVELKPLDLQFESLRSEEVRKKWRLSGVEMFKSSGLKEVEVLIVTPDWYDMDRDDLSERTRKGLKDWEGSVRQLLMPLSPFERSISP